MSDNSSDVPRTQTDPLSEQTPPRLRDRHFLSIRVLGIPLFAGSPEMAADHVLDLCTHFDSRSENSDSSTNSEGSSDITISENASSTPLRISATGAHGLVHARSDGRFRNTLLSCWINLPDGMPGVWVGKLKGASRMERCYGPDFFSLLMRRTSGTSVSHFLCGGADGVANDLAHVCRKRFGGPAIAGTLTPPFRDVDAFDYKSIGREIDRSGADIVWVGLSTPKQELFAEQLARHCHARVIISVGAAFDFHTGNIPRAPSWMQQTGLEWLFRLLSEPRRLWRRYAVIVPSFLGMAVADLLRWQFRKE